MFNFYFVFINQVLDSAPEVSVIFIPKIYKLEFIIDKLKKNKILSKILKNRKIFAETNDFEINKSLLEEFKLSIDLGNNCLFMGFYGGILYQTNLNLNSIKTIFAIDCPSIGNNYLSTLIKEKIYLTKQIKRNEIWNSFITHKESDYIFNKFFKSKKNYGVFIKMSSNYEFKSSLLFSKQWEIFNVYEKESKISSILLRIKSFFKIWLT
jgi:hypothetical protein